jgi:Sulfotransferase family
MTEDSIGTVWRFRRGDSLQRVRMLQRKLAARRRPVQDPPDRPIFIVGSPRSGTTLLFHMLRSHQNVWAMPSEGHTLWNAYQHPAKKAWSSDRAVEGDMSPRERAYVYTAIHDLAGDRRFVDKTPKNVLKLPYLAALFPTARFVFIKRDGRSVVGSLIEGWQKRRGISYRLPIRLRLSDYDGRLWSFILPPGWRDLVGTSIADVAAFQYASSCEHVLADGAALPEGTFVEVSYETLVTDPGREAERLLDALELPRSGAVSDFATNLASHKAASISPPRPEKWRDREEEVTRVLDRIAPAMARLGYEVEPSS